jgi:hypothetical protein
MIRRENEASSRWKAAESGSFHSYSTFETKPGTKTRSNGPSPITWYAIETSPERA